MGIIDLPDGYTEIKKVDMQNDKSVAILINAGAFIIAILLFVAGVAFVPLTFRFDNLPLYLLQCLGVLLAIIAYLFAHEFVHGIFIKKYSGQRAKYGFTGLYAFAGSDSYFNKRQYIVIALAPIVLFGFVFLLLNLILPREWFWPVYLIQIINLSGGAGDMYITGLMRRLPADVLVKDEGVSMTIYSRENSATIAS